MDINSQKINFLKQLMTDKTWRPIHTLKEIIIEKKMIEDSNIACFKSSGVINCKTDELIKYVWNIYNTKDNIQAFDPDITEYEIVNNIKNNSRVCRQVNKLPWPMWSRESVYLQMIKKDGDMSYIIMYSVDSDNVQEQPNKYVRSNVNISAYVFESCDSCTMMHRIAHIEPCGKIPSSLVNSYATKTASVIQHLMSIYN